jgi:hypothetical protein
MPVRPLISDLNYEHEHELEFVDLTSASSLQLSHRSTCHSRDIDPRLRQR